DLPNPIRAAFPYPDDTKRMSIFGTLIKHIATLPSVRSNFQSRVVPVDSEVQDITVPSKPIRSTQPKLTHSFNGFPKQNIETRWAWVGTTSDDDKADITVPLLADSTVKLESTPKSDAFVDIMMSSPPRSPMFTSESCVSVLRVSRVTVSRGRYQVGTIRANPSSRSASPASLPELEPYSFNGLRVPPEIVAALSSHDYEFRHSSKPYLHQYLHSPSSSPKRVQPLISSPIAATPRPMNNTPKRGRRSGKRKRASTDASRENSVDPADGFDGHQGSNKDLRIAVLDILKINCGKCMTYQSIWDNLPPALAATYHPGYTPARRLHRFSMMVRGAARANEGHLRRIKGGGLGRGKVGWMWTDPSAEPVLTKRRARRNGPADEEGSDGGVDDESESDVEAPVFGGSASRAKRLSFSHSDSDLSVAEEPSRKRRATSGSPTTSWQNISLPLQPSTYLLVATADQRHSSNEDIAVTSDDEEGSATANEMEIAVRWKRRRESALSMERTNAQPLLFTATSSTVATSSSPILPPLPANFRHSSFVIPSSPKRNVLAPDPYDRVPTMSPMSSVARTLASLRNGATILGEQFSSIGASSEMSDGDNDGNAASDSDMNGNDDESSTVGGMIGDGGPQSTCDYVEGQRGIESSGDFVEDMTFSIPRVSTMKSPGANGFLAGPIKSDSEATYAPSSPTMSRSGSFWPTDSSSSVNVALWTYSERVRNWIDEGKKLEDEGRRLMDWKAKITASSAV
ncbi:hypothetical protein HDU93_007322, partial [Gonapodya sp. JEL0774]